MSIMWFVVFSTFIVTFKNSIAQTGQSCPCLDPTVQSTTWGNWITNTVCFGGCNNAFRTRHRLCHIQREFHLPVETTNCTISKISNCSVCAGEWSLWSNLGPCNAICGEGTQILQRICYQKNQKNRFIRITDCRGSNGSGEQTKITTCRRLSNCPPDRPNIIEQLTSTTPRRSTTTTSQLQKTTTNSVDLSSTTTVTAIISATTLPVSTNASINDDNISESSNLSSSNLNVMKPHNHEDELDQISPTPVNGGFDTVTLAAILGSLTIVCITIVTISIAIVCLKRQDIKKNSMQNGNTSGSDLSKNSTQERPSDVNYDSLRHSRSSRIQPYPQVENPLYETTILSDEATRRSYCNRPLPPENQSYSSSTTHIYDGDPIYFSVDDLRR